MFIPVNYVDKGNYYEIMLENENGKSTSVKIVKQWVEKTMKNLDINFWESVDLWLSDKDIVFNEEQDKLNKQAKSNNVKVVVKSNEKTEKKKVVRERKPNPVKENIIKELAKSLENLNASDINIENIGKIITFKLDNREFKLDLTEKRVKKV